jgi:hypothetical protein
MSNQTTKGAESGSVPLPRNVSGIIVAKVRIDGIQDTRDRQNSSQTTSTVPHAQAMPNCDVASAFTSMVHVHTDQEESTCSTALGTTAVATPHPLTKAEHIWKCSTALGTTAVATPHPLTEAEHIWKCSTALDTTAVAAAQQAAKAEHIRKCSTALDTTAVAALNEAAKHEGVRTA